MRTAEGKNNCAEAIDDEKCWATQRLQSLSGANGFTCLCSPGSAFHPMLTFPAPQAKVGCGACVQG
jgi:hypothetical protein